MLGTLVFGRFFCGWGCHVVALQDLCAGCMKKVGVRPRPFRSRLLASGAGVLACSTCSSGRPPTASLAAGRRRCPAVHQPPGDHQTSGRPSPAPSSAASPSVVCGFPAVYFLGAKGFCTYGCPYGAIFGAADQFAPGRIRVTDACERLRPLHRDVHVERARARGGASYGMVVDPGCMKCMDCVSVCPNDALYFGFGKPSLANAKSPPIKRSFSLTWPEEIVAALGVSRKFPRCLGRLPTGSDVDVARRCDDHYVSCAQTWKMLRVKEMSFISSI